jgi:glycerate 2-kinase
MKTVSNPRTLRNIASSIFDAGIRAADPKTCIHQFLQIAGDRLVIEKTAYELEDIGKIWVAGAGKASAAMAEAVEEVLGDRIGGGVILTKYGHGKILRHCRVIEAGHPVPDENGVRGTEALLDQISAAGPGDLILCLLSGGGSALSPAPAEGLALADKREATRLLLSCGATIHEINAIRKHLSRIKGGRLCTAANGARIVSLIISDVVGDDLDVIASGATAPDPSTFGDCLGIIDRYGLAETMPPPVWKHLSEGRNGHLPETPKPGDPVFAQVRNHIVGNISNALSAAEAEARGLGFQPLVLSSMIQGEAAEVAKVLCAVAREVLRSGRPARSPLCLLSGGETTVTIHGSGLGGRNMELALAAAIAIKGEPGMLLLSAGTDGTDGPTDAAGAFADGSTVLRAEASGLSASDHLFRNDSYPFFQALGDLFLTGPTRTNVMDLQIFLINV